MLIIHNQAMSRFANQNNPATLVPSTSRRPGAASASSSGAVQSSNDNQNEAIVSITTNDRSDQRLALPLCDQNYPANSAQSTSALAAADNSTTVRVDHANDVEPHIMDQLDIQEQLDVDTVAEHIMREARQGDVNMSQIDDIHVSIVSSRIYLYL